MTAVTLVFQTVKSGFTLVYGIQNCDMISDAVFFMSIVPGPGCYWKS